MNLKYIDYLRNGVLIWAMAMVFIASFLGFLMTNQEIKTFGLMSVYALAIAAIIELSKHLFIKFKRTN